MSQYARIKVTVRVEKFKNVYVVPGLSEDKGDGEGTRNRTSKRNGMEMKSGVGTEGGSGNQALLGATLRMDRLK